MAVKLAELRDEFFKLINTLTGEEVIWQNQNAPTPQGDYLLLKITSLQMEGNDWFGSPIDNCLVQTQGEREIVLSVIAVSQDGLEILLDLVDKFELYSTLDLLTAAKMAYVGRDGDIIDFTTQINGSFETRASIDLRFRISKNYSSDTVDSIIPTNSIQYEGEFTNSDITINETILN